MKYTVYSKDQVIASACFRASVNNTFVELQKIKKHVKTCLMFRNSNATKVVVDCIRGIYTLSL